MKTPEENWAQQAQWHAKSAASWAASVARLKDASCVDSLVRRTLEAALHADAAEEALAGAAE